MEEIKDYIKFMVNILNDCITKYYKILFPDELDMGEFEKCCNEEELDILEKCYNRYKENDNITNDGQTNIFSILKAIIIYYYYIQVLEYYAIKKNVCIKAFLDKSIWGEDPIVSRNILNEITTSDDEYAKQIRRKILNFNGGSNKYKKKTIKKKKTYKKQRKTKSKKNRKVNRYTSKKYK